MKIVSFGDYTFPLYDTEDTIPLEVRRALTILPGGDGAYDVHGAGGPRGPLNASKRFTILNTTYAGQDVTLDQLRKVAGRGRQLLLFKMRNGDYRQCWAKMSLRYPRTPEHHSFLPVTASFDIAWPFFEAEEDRNYLGIHAGDLGAGDFPTDINTLWALWEADAITGLDDDDPVTAWEDQMGNSPDASQATGARQPLYKTDVINGLPVVRFDGVNDYLQTTGFSGELSQPNTIIAVYQTDTAGTEIVIDGIAATTRHLIYIIGSLIKGGSTIVGSGPPSVTTLTIAPTTSDFVIVAFVFNATSSQGWRNRFSSGAGDGGDSGVTGLTFGAISLGSGNFLDGDIAAVALLHGDPCAHDRWRIMEHWGAKYALPVRLGDNYTTRSISDSPDTFTITYNGGARFTGGYLVIKDACTDPKLTNLTNGCWVQWTGSLEAGDRLVIDLSTGRTKKNGVAQTYALSRGEFQTSLMALEFGDNAMQFEATAPALTLEYYWAKWYP